MLSRISAEGVNMYNSEHPHIFYLQEPTPYLFQWLINLVRVLGLGLV